MRCWPSRRPGLPTIVENAPPAARVCREEVFGPVVTVTPFDTDDEAIAEANDTPTASTR